MKKSLTLIMLLPLFVFSQKVAMIDRDLRKPVFYVQSLQMKHLEQGYFVLDNKDIKKVIDTINFFRSLIDDGKEIPENKKSIITGSTYFTTAGKKGNYSVVIDTKINKMGSYYVLARKDRSRKENLEAIDNFVAYLKKGN